MNRIYKLKFDKRRNELVVVSELTAGVGKAKATGSVEGGKAPRRGVRAMALSLLSGMIMMAHPVTAANLPTGGQIVAGSGSIQMPSDKLMNIQQNSQNMVTNWNSFDIGKGHTVQFYQPDSSSVALNRVVGGGESQIMGNLRANGQVFLVNPNGVLFGKDASVSTSGFVASTRDIKNDDFMNRRYTFSGGQKAGAAIVNQGALTTTPGGYIVLAADRVSNSGTIRTPDGKAVLAATERVTLQLDNGGLTSVQVTGDVVNALVENRGLVSARNGQVFLTAHGRDMLMNTVLNVSGVVEAGGMHRQDGNIVLDGGNSGVVHLSGTLQADNASGRGGKVVVQGQNLLLDKGSNIVATGSQGGGEVYVGGGWQGKDTGIRNADKVVMQDGARIDVSATQKGNGGTAVLWSESFTNFRGRISAKGGEQGGDGGQVETSSRGNLQAFGSVTASAKKGQAGNWLLDPEDITVVDGNDTNINNSTVSNTTIFEPAASGSMVSNSTINNQLNNGTSVTIQTSGGGSTASGNITVNADITKTNGSDASLTLKADGNITVNNNITSSAGKLHVNLSAANTSNGAITIGNNVNITTNGGDITAGTANASNSVTVNVTGSNNTLNATNGNITLTGSRVQVKNSNISAGNFTLNATVTGSEISNSTVNVTDNITLTAVTTTGASGVYLRNANLTSQNGSIVANGNSTANGVATHLDGNVTLTASNGNITLTGNSTNGTGVSFDDSNNTLNATNGNITLTGSRVQVKNSNISAGNFTLNATVTGSEISNSTVNVT
ncbi:filamentous hemagglutinin N-terminal domain-containing protein, partial [Escherichia coli]|uniref:two-partner secretion domain-containing protein n=1 Tax=Escherichia coli TaxID=562 RepID=UPI001EFC67A8